MRKLLALVLLASLAGGCKSWFTAETGARLVACGSTAVREKGLLYLGRVNDTIGNPQLTDRETSVRLGELGVEAGWDIIGCLLRDQQVKFGESARANPNDKISATAAKRADDKLRELEGDGWRFVD